MSVKIMSLNYLIILKVTTQIRINYTQRQKELALKAGHLKIISDHKTVFSIEMVKRGPDAQLEGGYDGFKPLFKGMQGAGAQNI